MIEYFLEQIKNGNLKTDVRFFLLKDKEFCKKFLDTLKVELLTGSKIPFLDQRRVGEILQKLTSLGNVQINAEILNDLVHLRALANLCRWKGSSFLYFLSYYLDESFLFSRGEKEEILDPFFKKRKAPASKVLPQEGGGTFGGSFCLKDNEILIYGHNIFVHLDPSTLHFILLHETGHFYLSYLRELFLKFKKTGSVKKAKEEVLNDFLEFQKDQNLRVFLNLFEDLRVEKFMYDSFRVTRESLKRVGDFLKNYLFEGFRKGWIEFLSQREALLSEGKKRKCMLLQWGIFLRFFVCPEAFGFRDEEEVWTFFTKKLPEFVEQKNFWEDVVRTAKKVSTAFSLSEVCEILKNFLEKWFPQVEQVEQVEFELPQSLENALGSEDFLQKFSESLSQELSQEEEEKSKEGTSDLEGEAEGGVEGENEDVDKGEERSTGKNQSGSGTSEGEESISEYLKRCEEKIKQDVSDLLNRLDENWKEFEKTLKNFEKSVEKDVASFKEGSEEKKYGMGILNSITGVFEITENDRVFFENLDSLKIDQDVLNELMRYYISGKLFVKHLLKRYKTRTDWVADREGLRVDVRRYVRNELQKKAGFCGGDFLVRLQVKSSGLPVKRIDLVVDTSGSMNFIQKNAKRIISYFLGVADELYQSTKGRFDFRVYGVRGEEENYLLDLKKCLKNPKTFGLPGVYLTSQLAFTAGREGFSAYVKPLLRLVKTPSLKEVEGKPFLIFVLTDAHFVTKEDWNVVESLKKSGYFTCGIYCTEKGEGFSEVENDLKQAFEGYFVGNLKNVKKFVEEFLTLCFKKREQERITKRDLLAVVNKVREEKDWIAWSFQPKNFEGLVMRKV